MATVNESLRDEAIAHSVWISRYATGVANRMVKLLNETDSELSARLLDALDRLAHTSATVSALNEFPLPPNPNAPTSITFPTDIPTFLVALLPKPTFYRLPCGSHADNFT